MLDIFSEPPKSILSLAPEMGAGQKGEGAGVAMAGGANAVVASGGIRGRRVDGKARCGRHQRKGGNRRG